jgi:hypothetical protein
MEGAVHPIGGHMHSVRTYGLALAATAMGAVASSGCVAHAAPPRNHGTRARVSSPTPAPAGGHPTAVSAGDQAKALNSVYAHAYHTAGVFPAELTRDALHENGIVPLADAVASLQRDQGAMATSRRRRAVAKLAAYSMVGSRPERQELTEAWHALLSDHPELAHTVQDELHPTTLGDVSGLETQVYGTLAALGTPGCTTKDAVMQPPVFQSNGEVSIEMRVTVEKDVDWVARRLDPQSWDSACNPYFAHAHLTKQPPPFPTRDARCPQGLSMPIPPENDAQPVGSAYLGKTLFEDFSCPICHSHFMNLLDVRVVRNAVQCRNGVNPCAPTALTPTSLPYEACYELVCPGNDPCAGALAGCMDDIPLEITRDWGDLTVCDGTVPGEVVAIITKNIKFSSTTMNLLAYSALLFTAERASTETLPEMVCCPL